MREDYAAIVQMTEQLLKATREATNLIVSLANDAKQDGPVYNWAHNTYHELADILMELATARQAEP